ncbi:hypothetical protein [Hamadaea tsunoensis]|uniref:hypothetical protein n=1 Tax=Hamadaea tsunoensis TaxID=53368 RepID=UPI0012FAF3E5|nr:hypothetical protein [Hamadaea tsunoensis]
MTRLRTLATTVAVAGLVLAAGACSKQSADSQSPSVTTTVGESPSASTAASVAPSASTAASSAASKGPSTLTFPTTAKAYGSALLSAYASGSSSHVEQLAVQGAVLQLKDWKNLDTHWTYISCDTDGGAPRCLYRNNNGDEAQLRFNESQLGHPTAVTEALINPTTYANNAADYANAFVYAWQQGNKQRMARYSSSSIASHYSGKNAPNGITSTSTTEADGIVTVTLSTSDSGPVILKVKSSLSGKAHAITGYCDNAC